MTPAPVPRLLKYVRDHLVALPWVRHPDTVGAGDEYPLWVQPDRGTPAPGELSNPANNDDAVLGLYLVPGIPVGSYNKFRRIDSVDFHLRVANVGLAEDLESRIREQFHDRRDWLMAGGLQVIESLQWRSLQPLGSVEQSDGTVWTFVTGYTFERYGES